MNAPTTHPDTHQPIPAFTMTGKVINTMVAPHFDDHKSVWQKKITLFQGHGVMGDNHARFRVIDGRETVLLRHSFRRGTEIFNAREWSAISSEEVAVISERMNVKISPGTLGENLIVSGIPNFSMLPAGTKLFFRSPDGEMRTAVLLVLGENGPCKLPGKAIINANPDKPELLTPVDFIRCAKHRRGLIGIVFSTGIIELGDDMIVEVPDQRPYIPPETETLL